MELQSTEVLNNIFRMWILKTRQIKLKLFYYPTLTFTLWDFYCVYCEINLHDCISFLIIHFPRVILSPRGYCPPRSQWHGLSVIIYIWKYQLLNNLIDYGVKRHFQQHFSHLVAVSFIGGENYRPVASHWQT
jgi:hypothetical protein